MASLFGTGSPRVGDEARTLLVSTKVSSLKALGGRVVVLRDSATVEQALGVMAKHKIISAPVIVTPEDCASDQALHDAGEAADILGFIDIKDILNSFLSGIDIPALNEIKLLQRMRILEDKGAAFGTTKLRDLNYIGTDGDFIHASQANSTLLDLVVNGLLQPRNTGSSGKGHVVHRIALFNNSGCITQIISQSDIIKFLHQHKVRLGPLGSMTVEDLKLISHHVEGVHPETPAIEAMSLMSRKRISSLAVLDANGKIVGNFSMSDMRTIVSEHFGALALPVGEFLASEHRTEYVGFNRLHEEGVEGTAGHKFVCDRVSRQRPRTPGEEVGQALVLGRKTTTLAQVIEMLVKHRIHRLYIVDEVEVPIGIITCTDILRKVLEATQ